MNKKVKKSYVCSNCQATHQKWGGKCDSCDEWNTLEEKTMTSHSGSLMPVASSGTMLVPTDLRTKVKPPNRFSSTITEMDRVLGGGFVEGSVVLLAGDPGAGKSTILLQVAAGLTETRDVLYVSGEENLDQIQMRAERLNLQDTPVKLVSSSDAQGIAQLMSTLKRGSLVIIDSLQTMDAGADSSPGSVSQVKAAAALFIPISKNLGLTTVLVNHVTKEGGFAGPQLLKHAVDTALHLQNDVAQGYIRVLRAEKNRFGADDEIGLFDMNEDGLTSITNPSDLFVSQRDSSAFGTVIFPSIEGTRPLLLEVQALVSPTTFGTGRRQAIGWDTGRMNMILAMMGPRLGISLGDQDVYINVAGGMKVTDPGMDLAAVVAIISAYQQRPTQEGIAVFGEVGLAGEVRRVQRTEARIKEAETLGFNKIICPKLKDDKKKTYYNNMEMDRVARILQQSDEIFKQS